jgi:hypothetical protein
VLHGLYRGANQIKFVSRPHPTGSPTDFKYTDFGEWGGGGAFPAALGWSYNYETHK